MKIRAAVTPAKGAAMEIETLDLDGPRADEVLVRMVASGICHTDLGMRDHQIYPIAMPAVLGHEGGGVVERVGASVTKVKPGDPVVLSFGFCGECPSCASHYPTYCADFFKHNFAGRRLDGSSPLTKDGAPIFYFQAQSSFASYAIAPERSVVKMPAGAPLDILCPLGCGVQTGAGAIINALKVGFGQSLAVFGAGSVGMSAIMAARLVGAGTIIAIDLVDDRLRLAREIGATHAINPANESVPEAIKKIVPRGVDFSFESTANMKVLRQSVEVLARRGMCGFVGGVPTGAEVGVDVKKMLIGGYGMRGIILGDSEADVFLPKLVKAYEAGQFPLDKIITFYPFEQINQAIHDSETGKAVKAVLRFPA